MPSRVLEGMNRGVGGSQTGLFSAAHLFKLHCALESQNTK
jgi:hypothetical protein